MLYGEQTQRCLQNFPFPTHTTHRELIYAITEIKQAAARANATSGVLDPTIAQGIDFACTEVLNGTHDSEFVTPSLQGGAGTSINMNVNEVIAQIATKHLLTTNVHPYDHVNASQSTNDVNPSALRITTYRLLDETLITLSDLINTCTRISQQYNTTKKLARTHLQDAVPTTIGAEYTAYATIFSRHHQRITEARMCLTELNLGGTAIGSHLNASTEYITHVYRELCTITNLPLTHSPNCMALTSSQTDFVYIGNVITILITDLSKMANDLRLLSSGPRGGFGEVVLPELQSGSSIMPGKINPVIPEVVNQVYQYCLGKQLSLQTAAERAELQLGVMFPIIADCLISITKETTAAITTLHSKCLTDIQFNVQQCQKNLEKSTAYATLLTPILGYDIVSKAVLEAIHTHTTIRDIICTKKLLTEEEFDRITTT